MSRKTKKKKKFRTERVNGLEIHELILHAINKNLFSNWVTKNSIQQSNLLVKHNIFFIITDHKSVKIDFLKLTDE